MDNTKIKKIILTIISAMLLITIIVNYVQFIQFMQGMQNINSSAFDPINNNSYNTIFLFITIFLIISLLIFIVDFIGLNNKYINITKIVLLVVLVVLEIISIIFTIIYLKGYKDASPGYTIVKEGQTTAYLYVSSILIPMIVSAGLLDVTLISTALIDGSFKLTKTKESDE